MIDSETASKKTGKILFISDYRSTAIVHTLEHGARAEVWIILGAFSFGKAIPSHHRSLRFPRPNPEHC